MTDVEQAIEHLRKASAAARAAESELAKAEQEYRTCSTRTQGAWREVVEARQALNDLVEGYGRPTP